ncbi:hypothetical protein M8C21_010914 [Ambrosia artemisiifolia]|uniref:Uncharacterized protein n=1 Tax=Ambrosia artemisiifolia TaxID=4212 RepID=A0AAD5D3L8_AMBAR|nr:hypothetical protein M8C21_010914 [Ambrosia artemisiifolia]
MNPAANRLLDLAAFISSVFRLSIR